MHGDPNLAPTRQGGVGDLGQTNAALSGQQECAHGRSARQKAGA